MEVLTDLAPGTRIVTRGATMISEGDQIRIVGEGERGAREAGPPQKAENRVPRTANAAEQRR
ncbi:MAG: hypothetical protein HYS04_16085 [Acidobacteria bacterium]|nr:hypothetical protein [Acidobacteriota bacterium]